MKTDGRRAGVEVGTFPRPSRKVHQDPQGSFTATQDYPAQDPRIIHSYSGLSCTGSRGVKMLKKRKKKPVCDMV